MEKNHILVISHRRSGTHLTIDAIQNNFPFLKKGYLNLDYLKKNLKKSMSLEKFKKELEKGPRIIKTHLYNDIDIFFDRDPQVVEFVRNLLKDNKKIYIKRDGREVMISLYFYMQSYLREIRKKSFSDFIRMKNGFDFKFDMNRIEFWKYHIDSWKNEKDVLFINFSDLKNNYQETLQKIAFHINFFKLVEVKNVFQNTKNEKLDLMAEIRNFFRKQYLRFFKNIKLTSIQFRSGNSGGYKKFFNNNDLIFYDEINKNKND